MDSVCLPAASRRARPSTRPAQQYEHGLRTRTTNHTHDHLTITRLSRARRRPDAAFARGGGPFASPPETDAPRDVAQPAALGISVCRLPCPSAVVVCVAISLLTARLRHFLVISSALVWPALRYRAGVCFAGRLHLDPPRGHRESSARVVPVVTRSSCPASPRRFAPKPGQAHPSVRPESPTSPFANGECARIAGDDGRVGGAWPRAGLRTQARHRSRLTSSPGRPS